jgi:hypothetical protein
MTKRVDKKTRQNHKPKVVRRRIVGLWMMGSSRGCPPIARAIYEEDTLEREGKTLIFRSKIARGDTIQVVQHSGMLNGSKREKEYHLKAFRPDLYNSIQAAAVLYQQIEQACLQLDEAHKRGEIG